MTRALPTPQPGTPPARTGQSRFGRAFAIAWLGILALVGLLAPWLAGSGSGVLTPFGPFERPRLSGSIRLAPGLSALDGAAQAIERRWSESTGDAAAFMDAMTRLGMTPEEARQLASTLAMPQFGGRVGPIVPGARLDGWPLARPHRLGTDALGQDVLANLIHGCQSALVAGSIGAGIALALGVTLGALMGFRSGWADTVLMRVVELFMSVPVMFLLILGVGVLPRSGLVAACVVGLVTWTGVARLTRAEVMRVRRLEFVDAARASGFGGWRIVTRHVLPSALGPAAAEAAFLFGASILFEATLAFLGLTPPDTASWGRLLAQAVSESGEFSWWLGVFPGAAVVFTVLACQSLSDRARG